MPDDKTATADRFHRFTAAEVETIWNLVATDPQRAGGADLRAHEDPRKAGKALAMAFDQWATAYSHAREMIETGRHAEAVYRFNVDGTATRIRPS